MTDRDTLIGKLREEIARCKAAKLDSRKENDMGSLPLAALNTRLTEYDKRIAAAERELSDLLVDEKFAEPETGLPEADDEQWDVFISYPHESETEAREVYEQLNAAGLRVWQDVNNIRHTSRWSLVVDGGLRSAERQVLLLTPEAMKSPEVFNEWFYFYKKKKPIHCLLVQACDLHYQLLPYQYLDWREPDKRDWARLLRELREDFTPPASSTPSPIVTAPSTPEHQSDPAVADLLDAARDPDGKIAFTLEAIKRRAEYKPADLAEYRVSSNIT